MEGEKHKLLDRFRAKEAQEIFHLSASEVLGIGGQSPHKLWMTIR